MAFVLAWTHMGEINGQGARGGALGPHVIGTSMIVERVVASDMIAPNTLDKAHGARFSMDRIVATARA